MIRVCVALVRMLVLLDQFLGVDVEYVNYHCEN